ncbi:MAG: hypothetical protein ABWY68_01105, partial [Cryobacterium sp.]
AQLPDAAADGQGVEHLSIVEGFGGVGGHVTRVPGGVLARNRKIAIFLRADPGKRARAASRVEA